MAEQRGKLTLTIVNNMLDRNPDNPWAAKQFFEHAKRNGRVDLKTAQTIDNQLRPAIDAATVRSLALKYGNEIDAANQKENETNPDNTRDRTATILNRIMSDSSIPLRLRQHVVSAASARAQYAKAAREEEYANTVSIVEEKQRQGVPESEIPEFYKLKPKDHEKMQWGPRTQSDFSTTTQWVMDPTLVTTENVKKNRDKLTGSDYQRWLKTAQEYEAQPAKRQDSIAKAKIQNEEFELMLATIRPKEFKDEKYRNSPKFYQERYAYELAVRGEMLRQGVETLPAGERMKIAETILNASSGSTSNWNPFNWFDGLDQNVSRGEVMTRGVLTQSTGRRDLAVPVSKWLPANPVTGEIVDDAQKVRTRLVDFFKSKTGKEPTTAQVASLWAKCFDANGNRIEIKELQ